MHKKVIPIILSGGLGTRLWPLSRSNFPKQYLNLISNGKKSLFQETQERLQTLDNILPPIIVCNEDHRFIVSEQMRQINIKPSSILLEPFGRNTAPAITIAALKAIEIEKDSTLLVLPADHHIGNIEEFRKVIEFGINCADDNSLITFGIIPTYPETGYGYIEVSDNINEKILKALKIKRFIEKPNHAKAEELIATGKFTWNSGIFVFKADIFLSEIEKEEKSLYRSCKKALSEKLLDLDFQRIMPESFGDCPNISIDVALMEKTKLGKVIPLNVGWSDIGSWKSIWENEHKNDSENVEIGSVFTEKTKKSYLRSDNRLIATLGVENLIVVETSDVVLIANKENSQDIKFLVEKLKSKGFTESNLNRAIYRPWGYFVSIARGDGWQVKRIVVNSGASLSLQLHKYRAEHWIIVSGIAKVELNNEEKILYENQSTFIPIATKHRLSNPGEGTLSLIEVQSGTYIDEDDIVRFEDNYGRENKK